MPICSAMWKLYSQKSKENHASCRGGLSGTISTKAALSAVAYQEVVLRDYLLWKQ